MSERRWTWRAADAGDYEDQRRLFNACFRKDKGLDTFRWKYAENPHGPAVSRVALNDEGAVVGGYSYVPRWFRRDGERLLLMQASDAMVDTSARRQGIFTGLDDIVCEASGALGVPWAYAYSGRLSFNGFLGNGWQCIGHAAVWRYRFRSRRGLARTGRIAPLAVRAAPLLDAAWRRRDRRLGAHVADRAALVPLERYDERMDRLSQAVAPSVGLWGERDAAWMNWRYVDNPSGRQQSWALTEGGPEGELLGVLVSEHVDGNAYLVDHLARDEATRRRLLAAFTTMAWERGMEEATALLFDHNPAVPLLADLGWRRPRTSKPFRDIFPWIIRACRDDAPTADEQMSRWHLADGDRDAEHMSP